VNNDNTLAVLADSGSNINIIQQKDIRFWGIPETYENRPGRLNGIGTLPTLGVFGLVWRQSSNWTASHDASLVASNDKDSQPADLGATCSPLDHNAGEARRRKIAPASLPFLNKSYAPY